MKMSMCNLLFFFPLYNISNDNYCQYTTVLIDIWKMYPHYFNSKSLLLHSISVYILMSLYDDKGIKIIFSCGMRPEQVLWNLYILECLLIITLCFLPETFGRKLDDPLSSMTYCEASLRNFISSGKFRSFGFFSLASYVKKNKQNKIEKGKWESLNHDRKAKLF